MTAAPYPFSAIVGQDDLKTALLLNAVSPAIGGVLVRGEKGTAKSTAARALQRLLPEIDVVKDCVFNCDPDAPDPDCPAAPHDDAAARKIAVPLVELPIGASTDRVAGSLDLEEALTKGHRSFTPGLLAAAHRGILYADEVNLLPDALVDLLLDAAALGVNYVEREGMSVRHASRFLLVGTMNPEEGELRPQLLDRFGIAVQITASEDAAERAEVVRRRLRYEADSAGFLAEFSESDRALALRILSARDAVSKVRLDDALLERIASACASLGVDGMRADLVTAKASIALAAWDGRDEVVIGDVRRALALAVPHRRRRGAMDEPGVDPGRLDRALDDPGPQSRNEGGASQDRSPNGGESKVTRPKASVGERTEEPQHPFVTRVLQAERGERGPWGRRTPGRGDHGHPVGDRPTTRPVTDLSLSATVRAAAPFQLARGRRGPGLVLYPGDLRRAMREGREANLVLFVVDASGSMGARRRMAATKGAVLSLLVDAYQRRDRVGLVAFRNSGAEVLLPPTSSVELAASRLRALRTGGRTPLAAGLRTTELVLRSEHLREATRRSLVVVVTDGRANSGADPHRAAERVAQHATCVVVDAESGPVRLGMAAELARSLGAECLRLDELRADALVSTVRRFRGDLN